MKARAYRTGWTASAVGSAGYTVYPDLALSDENGTSLPAAMDAISGSAYTFSIGGGSGSYTANVQRPNGSTSALSISAGQFTVNAPSTGAFAGTYTVTLTDTATNATQAITITVPLKVEATGTLLLSRDANRNTMDVAVRGASAGATVTLTLDSAADAAGITLTPVNSGVAESNSVDGNPAFFALAVPDTLAVTTTVTLDAITNARSGTGTIDAVAAVIHQGTVHGTATEAVVGGTVTLMRAVGAADPLPWEDEIGRITATSDADGAFVLYAPPAASGETHSLQVTAAGYAAVSEAADNCTGTALCALTMAYETTAAAPTFNPPAGSYEGSVLVTLESTTVGATLRYTLDGSTPSETNGTEIASGTAVQINASGTLKAIAYKAGLNPSEVSEAAYVITNPPMNRGGGGGFDLLALFGVLAAFRLRGPRVNEDGLTLPETNVRPDEAANRNRVVGQRLILITMEDGK